MSKYRPIGLLRRIEKLEAKQDVYGLRLFVRFDGDEPTHYHHEEPWDVELFLQTGVHPSLSYLFLAQVLSEWEPEPEESGFLPLPEELDEDAARLIQALRRSGQVHRVGGKVGNLDGSGGMQDRPLSG